MVTLQILVLSFLVRIQVAQLNAVDFVRLLFLLLSGCDMARGVAYGTFDTANGERYSVLSFTTL